MYFRADSLTLNVYLKIISLDILVLEFSSQKTFEILFLSIVIIFTGHFVLNLIYFLNVIYIVISHYNIFSMYRAFSSQKTQIVPSDSSKNHRDEHYRSHCGI